MLDKITVDRIATLHPDIRKEVLDMYTYANEKLLGKGVRLRFAYTYRTTAEQAELYAQGRTKLFDNNGKRLGIVTNAKPGQSIHNYGLALDIVLVVDKDGDGIFETASWDIKADFDKDGTPDWKEVTDYFKTKGYTWGGDWTSLKDYPHFEKTGYTWQAMQKKVNAGEVIKEVINGITYIYPKLK